VQDIGKQETIRCLWMDLKTSVTVVDTPAVIARRCDVTRTSGFDAAAVEAQDPDFVVLEFDYPSRQDLARASRFKEQYPGVPMVVVTVQHSEALAVWFFRARFYDYLVQPLPGDEVANCIARLKEIAGIRRAQSSRRCARAPASVPAEAGSQGCATVRLQPALTLIERNYHRRLLVTEVAEACGMAAFRFGREFKELFGMDFREYLLRYRIREACRLLRNPKASITEIGYSVGFSEPSYFTKMFKKHVGRRPSEVVGVPHLEYSIDGSDSSPNYQTSSAKS
jgi:AraC-like DNA-binding protein